MKNLMIVTHPDDELIFGGAQLLNGEEWHIVCLTHECDSRGQQFKDIHNEMGNTYDILDHPDNKYDGTIKADYILDLFDIIESQQWNKIVSHGLEGEYGHPQHMELHKIVAHICKENQLKLYTFGLSEVKLDDNILAQKLHWLNKYNDGIRNFNISNQYHKWIEHESCVEFHNV